MNLHIQTPDGRVVKPGQIWRSVGRRRHSPYRRVKEVCHETSRATLQACTPEGEVLSPRTSRVQISRMTKTSTGYLFVREAPPPVTGMRRVG